MDRSLSIYESLSDEKKECLLNHLHLVIEANKRVNLTRIDDEESGLLLHVEDSLSALPEIEDAPEGRYADMGSGAGYPGIPICVATGRKTLLIDFRKRKMDVMSSIISQLQLDSIADVYAGRAELLAIKEKGCFSVITARAVSTLSVLLELASPLLAKGGRLVCYKSNVDEQEMNHALEVCNLVGMGLVSQRSFLLGGEYTRQILSFEKKGTPKIKLPRLEGQAQKNPL